MAKMIGSGAYGCVYKPPLCYGPEETPLDDLVGKVSESESVKNELEASKLIRQKIPDWREYYGILSGKSCHPQYTADEIDKCPVLKTTKDESKVDSYSSDYLGTPLYKYQDTSVTTDWLWKSFVHLVVAVNKLHINRIYHMDINGGNILIDDKGNCRLIDFGLAIINPKPDNLGKFSFFKDFPLFYNAYLTREIFGTSNNYDLFNDPYLLVDYRDAYADLCKFYNPNYERGTASDEIIISLYRASLYGYPGKVVLPNLGKVDLYRLADNFNDLFNHQVKLKILQNYSAAFDYKWSPIINGMLNPDVNQQWNMKKVLEYIINVQKEETAIVI